MIAEGTVEMPASQPTRLTSAPREVMDRQPAEASSRRAVSDPKSREELEEAATFLLELFRIARARRRSDQPTDVRRLVDINARNRRQCPQA